MLVIVFSWIVEKTCKQWPAVRGFQPSFPRLEHNIARFNAKFLCQNSYLSLSVPNYFKIYISHNFQSFCSAAALLPAEILQKSQVIMPYYWVI